MKQSKTTKNCFPLCQPYVNLFATRIVFRHLGLLAWWWDSRSTYWTWIISVFDQRSIMNWLYWHYQQVGWISLFYSICMGTKRCHCCCGRLDRDDFVPLAPVPNYSGMVMRAQFGSQTSIALNWHSRYSGMCYGGTEVIIFFPQPQLLPCGMFDFWFSLVWCIFITNVCV